MISNLFGFLSNDIGIDLGTANTLVFVKGDGIVLREPSVVARYKTSKKVCAVGADAKRMLGRTPGTIEALRPMKDGVIADLRFLKQCFVISLKKWIRENWCPPCGHRPIRNNRSEKRAVKDSAIRAGARKSFFWRAHGCLNWCRAPYSRRIRQYDCGYWRRYN